MKIQQSQLDRINKITIDYSLPENDWSYLTHNEAEAFIKFYSGSDNYWWNMKTTDFMKMLLTLTERHDIYQPEFKPVEIYRIILVGNGREGGIDSKTVQSMIISKTT